MSCDVLKVTGLTASGTFPPGLDRDPRSLAYFSVILQSLAKEISMASSHANIIFTVLQIHLRVNGAVAFPERPIFLCDDSTEFITAPTLHVFVLAAPTPTHAVISALSIVAHPRNLPATSKGHGIVSLGAPGGHKVIAGVAVEVAAEPTSLTSKSLGHTDEKTTVPVVSDRQAKVRLNKN